MTRLVIDLPKGAAAAAKAVLAEHLVFPVTRNVPAGVCRFACDIDQEKTDGTDPRAANERLAEEILTAVRAAVVTARVEHTTVETKGL